MEQFDHTTRDIERFEDYAIEVSQPYTHNLHFEVKRIVGETLDPPPAGLLLYECEDSVSSLDTTAEFAEGELFLDGDVKWDGCSNWTFNCEPIMMHFCGRNDTASLGRLLDHLYQITKERLEVYEGD